MINLEPWLEVFAPIAAIGLGIAISLAVLRYFGNAIVGMMKREIEKPGERERAPLVLNMDEFMRGFNRFMDVAVGEKAKREPDNLDPEEKPKRKNEEFTLGDDGELINVSDEDSLTLDDLLNDSRK